MYPEVVPVRAPFFAPLACPSSRTSQRYSSGSGSLPKTPKLTSWPSAEVKLPLMGRTSSSLTRDGHVVESGHASSQLCRIGKRTGVVEGDGPGGGFGGKVAFQTGIALGSEV